MCVVSMIMDHYNEKWKEPPYQPIKPIDWPQFTQPSPSPFAEKAPSQEEISEFRRLLERAREYDKRNNEPDCEMASKREALIKLAEHWKIDISFV